MKGDYNDVCNINRCDNDKAVYFNHSTRRYYCKSCANRLNEDPYNKRDAFKLFGHDLCTIKHETTTIRKLAHGASVEELQTALFDVNNEIQALETTKTRIENLLYQRQNKTVDYRLTDFYIQINNSK